MYAVLLSGGIDSLVCAEQLRQAGQELVAIFVDYGHPAQVAEGWKAFAFHGRTGVPLRVVHAFGLNLGDMGAASGARVMPGRNLALLALAANAAPGATIVIGCNADDQADYADCRPDFLAAASSAIGAPVSAPLLHLNKRDVIAEARRLGLSRDDAWACYGAGPVPCGACPCCVRAEAAWR